MQATKFKLTVEVEVLSLDAIPALICELVQNIQNENRSGSLLKEDGDHIKWGVNSERVDF